MDHVEIQEVKDFWSSNGEIWHSNRCTKMEDPNVKRIVFTSTLPPEGKTYCKLCLSFDSYTKKKKEC
jgi:hypothetical protein